MKTRGTYCTVYAAVAVGIPWKPRPQILPLEGFINSVSWANDVGRTAKSQGVNSQIGQWKTKMAEFVAAL